jgi:hypothetical protein
MSHSSANDDNGNPILRAGFSDLIALHPALTLTVSQLAGPTQPATPAVPEAMASMDAVAICMLSSALGG